MITEILKQQISNDPDFPEIERFVVINAINVSAQGSYFSAFNLNYKIQYMKDGQENKKFKERTSNWEISNGKNIWVRDEFNQPIISEEYTAAVAANLLPKTIDNPGYISEEETPYLPTKIPNPAYVSDDSLLMMEQYKTAPAFDYIMGMFLAKPELLWVILGFYVNEQDKDNFFDNFD